MSIFTDTMVEAIRKYRTMLRKHLPQAERVNHLQRLNLKNPQLYCNEVLLYQLGHKVIDHLSELDDTKSGYYSYSGISQFASHLKKFLDKYKIDKLSDRVVHTSQLASRHMVKATQILSLNPSTEKNIQELERAHELIILYGSSEQIELYQQTLQNMMRKHAHDRQACYRNALSHFNSCLQEKVAAA